jgi:hypothetical protein
MRRRRRCSFRAGLLEAAEPIGKLGIGRMRRRTGTQEQQRGDDDEWARRAMPAKLTTSAMRASARNWSAAALANPMRLGHR